MLPAVHKEAPKETILHPLRGGMNVMQKKAIRNWIASMEEGMVESPECTTDCDSVAPTVNHVWGGMFVREIFMPAGAVIVSKIHKVDHLTFVLEGEAEVIDEFGSAEIYKAPAFIKTPAGMKRILRIKTDSRWMTVHQNPDGIEDADEFEKHIISPTHLDLLEGE